MKCTTSARRNGYHWVIEDISLGARSMPEKHGLMRESCDVDHPPVSSVMYVRTHSLSFLHETGVTYKIISRISCEENSTFILLSLSQRNSFAFSPAYILKTTTYIAVLTPATCSSPTRPKIPAAGLSPVLTYHPLLPKQITLIKDAIAKSIESLKPSVAHFQFTRPKYSQIS